MRWISKALLMARATRSLPDAAKTARRFFVAVLFFIGLTPGLVWACACGCSVFDVGTSSLFPEGSGGTAWLEYDYSNQYLNWHASQIASANNNNDKRINTNFYTLGVQYMFNHDWGLMATAPFDERHFKTLQDDGTISNFTHNAVGDIRIWGMYTGFFDDMSTGLLVGIKLPNGDWTYPNFDRDTEIGTGSYDILLGGYHQGLLPLKFRSRSFNWFVQTNLDVPVATRGSYRPGKQFDSALGSYYNFGRVSVLSQVAPMLQFISSYRFTDEGIAADPADTGFSRVMIAPAVEVAFRDFQLYTDIEIPIYQNFNGNQLTAPFLMKTLLSYSFNL